MQRRHQPVLRVFPADQRLHADDAAAGDVVLRLVMQAQLVALQRPPQTALQGQPLERTGVHVLRKELVVVAAVLLGVIHGRISIAQQGIDVSAVAGINGDAHARGGHQLMPVDVVGARHCIEYLLRRNCDVTGIGHVRHQNDELVAAQATDGVAGAHAQPQPARHLLQQLIADAVTKRVVDRLEPVQIQEHDGHAGAVALRQGHRLRDPVGQQDAVGQVGERIVVSQMPHALLALLALGDVGEDLDVVDRPPLRIAHHADGQPLGKHFAVAAPVPHLPLPVAVAVDFCPQLELAIGTAHARAQ
jgi:hypothetical protein